MASSKSAKHSLLWSVSDHRGSVSYLFGTMHVRSQTAHQFLEGVLPYIHQAEMYVAEMNLEEFDIKTMQENTTLSLENSWYSHTKPRRFAKMRAIILKSFDVDLYHYRDRHPFLIMSAIAESLLSNDMMESLDQELWNQASKFGKTCTGLESFQEQMEIMNRISVHDAIKQIYQISMNPGRFRRSMKKMIGHYVTQDVTKLYQASRRQLQGLRKMMLFARNENMVDRLVQLMQEQTVFVAVGAAHLGGKQGMLRLLKRRGFRIDVVKLNQTI